ncbi:DUF6600 domain-containing protein [Chryseolinea sp. T2]|uniref:DUF6600 domain-containing protein n=1 Tax=Chryseolinea sp. T2 TaxID=3129255 RepID=UPI00307809AA
MRKVWSKWLAVAVFAVGTMAATVTHAQGSVSLQVFYDELQPYGTWVDHGRYGYVWMPNAGADFVPYGSNGYWVQTSYGNTWVSNYNWGWAPFHYGRWFYDDFYGWLWVPDTTWGPAWVTWRSGGGYYGWAPLMPGLSVSMSVGYYSHIPNHYWNFVPYRYVMYRQVYRHCVPRTTVVNVINHTTVIVNNNYYGDNNHNNGRDRRDHDGAYFTGPSRSEVEKRNGERIPVYEVHDRNAPGRTDVSRNSVSLYKPAVDHETRTRALPSEFTRDNEQGREAIQSRRQSQQGSGTYNDFRDAQQRGELGNRRESLMESPRRSDDRNSEEIRDIESLRRGTPSPDSRDFRNENNNPVNRTLDRVQRDREFNDVQRERELNQQRSQQRDVEIRRRSNRDEEFKQFEELQKSQMRQQEQQERQMRQRSYEPSQDRQPRQRSYEQSQDRQPQQRSYQEVQRGAPARERSQFQQSSPSRGQRVAPAQQQQRTGSRTRSN